MVLLQAALAATVFLGAGQAVLLEFCSDSCGPCRAIDPTVQALIAKGYPVRKVNFERERALAAQYGVTSIPCFVMLVDGREVNRVVGSSHTFTELERICKAGLAQAQAAAQTAQAGPPGAGPSIPASPIDGAPPVSAAVPPLAASPPRTSAPNALPPLQTFPVAMALGGRSAAPVFPRTGEAAPPDEGMIAATVRLRIEDQAGHSCGSGTIIDARGGKALVLTCGHIFRDSQGRGQIDVDLFGPYAGRRVPGKLIGYDLERDVGLVCIDTPGPVAATRVAPPGYRIGQGEPVISVGCNNGNPPTAVRSRVTSLDKFLGPPNVQVAGQPIEGRSGGGLFSDDGLVIGVCNAADPSDREGLFAALASVQAVLDRAGLSFVYQPAAANSVAQAPPFPRGMLVPVEQPALPKRMPGLAASPGPGGVPASAAAASTGDWPRLSKEEQAALEEIRRRLQDGAEVICVVRSRQDPQAKSEVIMLDRVSPDFVRQLAAEARTAEVICVVRSRQDPQAKSEVIMLDRVSPDFVRQLAAEARTQEPRHLTSLEIPRASEAAGGRLGGTGVWPVPGRDTGKLPVPPAR